MKKRPGLIHLKNMDTDGVDVKEQTLLFMIRMVVTKGHHDDITTLIPKFFHLFKDTLTGIELFKCFIIVIFKPFLCLF